jgi:(2Fe-2S) ferredoxin
MASRQVIYTHTKTSKRKLHKTVAAIWFNKVKPAAATAVIELLMMGGKMPEIR